MYKINGNPEQFADLEVFHKLAQQFLPFARERMNFDKPVGINLISDPENAKNPLGKTAYYDPNKLEIAVFIDKRHIKDILRSLSHELIHHTQNCRGEFDGNMHTGPGYAQEDGHMRKMEEEAYLEGQMVLRDFEDNLKKEERKMSNINETKLRVHTTNIAKNIVNEDIIEDGVEENALLEDDTDEKVWKIKHEDANGEEITITVFATEEIYKDRRLRRKYETKARRNYDKREKKNENWFKGNKDQLLFEELTKKWVK